MSKLKESSRFKRTINPYKEKKLIIEKTMSTTEKIHGIKDKMSTNIKKSSSDFKDFQDKLRKQFPGLTDKDWWKKI